MIRFVASRWIDRESDSDTVKQWQGKERQSLAVRLNEGEESSNKLGKEELYCSKWDEVVRQVRKQRGEASTFKRKQRSRVESSRVGDCGCSNWASELGGDVRGADGDEEAGVVREADQLARRDRLRSRVKFASTRKQNARRYQNEYTQAYRLDS